MSDEIQTAYIALTLQPNRVLIDGKKEEIKLPNGCVGIFLAFDSEESALDYFGKDKQITFAEINLVKKEVAL